MIKLNHNSSATNLNKTLKRNLNNDFEEVNQLEWIIDTIEEGIYDHESLADINILEMSYSDLQSQDLSSSVSFDRQALKDIKFITNSENLYNMNSNPVRSKQVQISEVELQNAIAAEFNSEEKWVSGVSSNFKSNKQIIKENNDHFTERNKPFFGQQLEDKENMLQYKTADFSRTKFQA